MQEVLGIVAASQAHAKQPTGPISPRGYTRPTACIHYCAKNSWCEEPSLTTFKNCAPDKWENIRYRIEQASGLHNDIGRAGSSFFTAQIVTNFESRDLKTFPHLADDDLVDEDAVIIVSRKPSVNGLGHYVPLDLLEEWETWITQKLQKKDGTKSAHTHSKVEKRDFYTATHSWGRHGWFPRRQLHASHYSITPPKYWHCPRCNIAGEHWENMCLTPDAEIRTNTKNIHLIHGIPRSQLRMVERDSEEGRKATLRDSEGNLYVDKIMEQCQQTTVTKVPEHHVFTPSPKSAPSPKSPRNRARRTRSPSPMTKKWQERKNIRRARPGYRSNWDQPPTDRTRALNFGSRISQT